MPVQARWTVIHMEGRKLWPGYSMTKHEPFTSISVATHRAEELSEKDDVENDHVIIWDSALGKVVWGPQ